MQSNPAAREPEIFREQVMLNERLAVMEKAADELGLEIRSIEHTLKITLRPAQDKENIDKGVSEPEPPPCLTPLGDDMRGSSHRVVQVTRRLYTLTEILRDIRDRCELPRLPEEAQAMPETSQYLRDIRDRYGDRPKR